MAQYMSKEELKKLEKENRDMKDARVCICCRDKIRSKLFLPCAHLTLCELCFPAFKRCPQCKSNIKGIVHVYL